MTNIYSSHLPADHPLKNAWEKCRQDQDYIAFYQAWEAFMDANEKTIVQPPAQVVLTESSEPLTDKQFKLVLLEIIATQVPFSHEAITLFYEHYQSIDLLLEACAYCAKTKSQILIVPPAEYI